MYKLGEPAYIIDYIDLGNVLEKKLIGLNFVEIMDSLHDFNGDNCFYITREGVEDKIADLEHLGRLNDDEYIKKNVHKTVLDMMINGEIPENFYVIMSY